MIEEASKSKIVKAQIKNKKKNVFNGKAFDDPDDENGLNMEDFFKVDEEAFKNAFKVDTSKMNMDSSIFSDMDFSDVDLSDLVDGDALADAMPSFSQNYLIPFWMVIRNLWVITRKQILQD